MPIVPSINRREPDPLESCIGGPRFFNFDILYTIVSIGTVMDLSLTLMKSNSHSCGERVWLLTIQNTFDVSPRIRLDNMVLQNICAKP